MGFFITWFISMILSYATLRTFVKTNPDEARSINFFGYIIMIVVPIIGFVCSLMFLIIAIFEKANKNGNVIEKFFMIKQKDKKE